MGWCGYAMLQSSNSGGPVGLAVAGFSPFTLLTVLIDPYTNAGNQFIGDDATSSRVEVFILTWIAIGLYTVVVWTMYKSMVKNFDMTIRKQSR
jgi:hypothetical protein